MGIRVITPPAAGLISLEDARDQCRADGTAHDATLTRLIASATRYVERATGRSLLTTVLELSLDRFPNEDDPAGAVILLRRGDVQSITHVKYLDENDVEQTLAAATYVLDASENPARLSLANGKEWPSTLEEAAAVKVRYSAGYGAAGDTVPEDLLHAVRLVLAHWFTNREGVVTGTISTALQHSVDALLDSHRLAA